MITKRELRPTVAIATLRASDELRAAIASLTRQDGFTGDLELLVVAPRVEHEPIRRLCANLPELRGGRLDVRLLAPDAPGLSRARNLAAREASGDVVAFVDDDAVASRGWLRSLLACFREEPDAGAAGGPIRLLWGSARPAWWEDALSEAYNAIDFGPLRRRLHYPQIVYGTNIAFRRERLLEIGLFREDLGRAPGSLRAGEEAELQLRMEKQGYWTVFEPRALVEHRVAIDRLSPGYIRRRAFHHGRSHSLLERGLFESRKGALGRALRASTLLLRIPFSPRRHLAIEKELFFEAGYLFEEARGALHRRKVESGSGGPGAR